MARALINVPAKAKRGEVDRDQDADLAPDGDRLSPWHQRASIPRDIITALRRHLQRRGDFPRRALSRHRRQSFHHLLHGRHRERHHRFNGPATTASRRPSRPRSRWNERARRARPARHRRRAARPCPASPPISRSTSAAPPTTDEPPRPRPCRTTTRPIPACCGCWTARRCGAQGGRGGQAPAPTATARPRKHEGRRRALSGLRRGAADARSTSKGASTSAAPSSSRPRRSPSRARTCWRSPPTSRSQSRGMPIAIASDASRGRSSRRARHFRTRQGQLNLACAQLPRRQLGPEAGRHRHPAGAPDRLPALPPRMAELGSLQRRLRNCLIGMRAEPYAYGAPEYVALELS